MLRGISASPSGWAGGGATAKVSIPTRRSIESGLLGGGLATTSTFSVPSPAAGKPTSPPAAAGQSSHNFTGSAWSVHCATDCAIAFVGLPLSQRQARPLWKPCPASASFFCGSSAQRATNCLAGSSLVVLASCSQPSSASPIVQVDGPNLAPLPMRGAFSMAEPKAPDVFVRGFKRDCGLLFYVVEQQRRQTRQRQPSPLAVLSN